MKPTLWILGMLMAGLLALSPGVDANDTLINVEETGPQSFAALAQQSTGETFIVWGSNGNIVGRRFAPDGSALDLTDVLIGEGGQRPRIDMNDSGQAVIAWQTSGGPDSEAFARIVPFDGSPPSDVFMVNIVTNGSQRDLGVAVAPNGEFFIAYESASFDGSNAGVALRHYDANGMPLSGEQLVNTNATQGNQAFPALAKNANGDFAIAWLDLETNESYLRFYNSDGTAATDPIEAAGGFDMDIAYSDQGQVLLVFGFSNLFAAIYDTQGTLVFGPIQIDEDGQNATKPAATALASGDFQIAWTQAPGTETNREIYSLTVLADGSTPEPPFRVNRITSGVQAEADVRPNLNNEYLVVFQGPDSSSTGIYASCLQPDGCVEIFVDGFESGDVASWSASMP